MTRHTTTLQTKIDQIQHNSIVLCNNLDTYQFAGYSEQVTLFSRNVKPVELVLEITAGEPAVPEDLEMVQTHLRPDSLEVPEENPYQHDALDRREFANSLSKLIQFGSGSGVIALDGGWGSGKTSFVKMWAQDARNRGHVVVVLNAWDGDYQGSALKFIAVRLAVELKEAFLVKNCNIWWYRTKRWFSRNRAQAYNTIKAGANLVAALDGGTTSNSLHVVTRLVASLDSVTGDMAADAKLLEQIRYDLRSASRWINEESRQKPEQNSEARRLIIVVDELDRCRPDYAVLFMETIKHVFEVDHVTFVVAVNMEQLQHTVMGLYGSGFDGLGYLERFFDIRLSLPSGSRREFVEKSVEQSRLAQFFGRDLPSDPASTDITASDLLVYMFTHSSISLREIQKALRHLQIMLLFNQDSLGDKALGAVALLAIRAIERRSYEALETGMRGRSDALVSLASALGTRSLDKKEESQLLMDLIHASCETAQAKINAGLMARRDSPNQNYGKRYDGNYNVSERYRMRAGISDYTQHRDMIEMTARMVDLS